MAPFLVEVPQESECLGEFFKRLWENVGVVVQFCNSNPEEAEAEEHEESSKSSSITNLRPFKTL